MKKFKVRTIHLAIITILSAALTFGLVSLVSSAISHYQEKKRWEEIEEYKRITWEDNLQKTTENQEHFLIVAEAIFINPSNYIPDEKYLNYPIIDSDYYCGGVADWEKRSEHENKLIRKSFTIVCDDLRYSFRVLSDAKHFPNEPIAIIFYYHRYYNRGILYFPDNMSETRKNQLIDEWTSFGGTGEEITPNLYAYYQGLPYGV